MQSDSMIATDYSRSSQLWGIFVLLTELFCLETPLKKILHVHSQWLAPAREQITLIPKTGGLEGHKLSTVIYRETALQQHYVPPAAQPWHCCGCQAHSKAGLQIHLRGCQG